MPSETSISEPSVSPENSLWPLAWLSATAMDAPFVCVGWFLLLAVEAEAHPSISTGIVLGLSVWLAYMADRWFDGFRLTRPGADSFRHQFARANRPAIGLVWVCVLVATLFYAFNHLPAPTLRLGLVLLVVVLTYFGAIHLGPRWLRDFAPKEFATALILVAGILLFLPWGSVPHPITSVLIALFFANCILIDRWESSADRAPDRGFLSPSFRFRTRWTRLLLAIITGFSVCASFGFCGSGFRAVWSATGISALLLLLLDLTRHRWSPPNVRALADIALMVPWAFLPFL